MRIIPYTDDGWVSLMLLPFRAYGVVAFIFTSILDRRLRDDSAILWVLFGYVVCLLVLAITDTVLTFRRQPGEPRPTWLWTLATLVFTLTFAGRFLPVLAQ
jgi:hypothetical protein